MPRPKNRDKTRTKNFKPKTGKSYAERQPVSYTHLDVYKRQILSGQFAM